MERASPIFRHQILTDVALDSFLLRDAVQLDHGRVTDDLQDVREGLGPLSAEMEGEICFIFVSDLELSRPVIINKCWRAEAQFVYVTLD